MSIQLLLVEDEPDIQLIARAALQRAGFEVRTADSGEAALAAVAAERPDLVVLDRFLPALDGFATCDRLRQDPASRDIPVVFLTARPDPSTVAAAAALGALGCIAKPFNPLTLGAQVLTLWRGAEAGA